MQSQIWPAHVPLPLTGSAAPKTHGLGGGGAVRTGGPLAIRCCSVLLLLWVWPRSPMMPTRMGKASGETAEGLVKLSSGLSTPAGSPHLLGTLGFRGQINRHWLV